MQWSFVTGKNVDLQVFREFVDLFQRLIALFSTQDQSIFVLYLGGRRYAGCSLVFLIQAQEVLPARHIYMRVEVLENSHRSTVCCVSSHLPLLHSALQAACESLQRPPVWFSHHKLTITAHKQEALIWHFNLTDHPLIFSTSLNYPLWLEGCSFPEHAHTHVRTQIALPQCR